MKSTKKFEGLTGKRVIALRNENTDIIKGEIYYMDREFDTNKGYYFISKTMGGSCDGIFCPSDLGVIYVFYEDTIINNYEIY